MKTLFVLKKDQTLLDSSGRYLNEPVKGFPPGKYRVRPSPRGSWRFQKRESDYVLFHLEKGRWRHVQASNWCSSVVSAWGLAELQRFTVTRVK